MIVCVCRRVSDRTVEAAILAGARDVDAIARATGAGADCGCCREELAVRAAERPPRERPGAAAPRGAPCCATPCPGCPGQAARGRAA